MSLSNKLAIIGIMVSIVAIFASLSKKDKGDTVFNNVVTNGGIINNAGSNGKIINLEKGVYIYNE